MNRNFKYFGISWLIGFIIFNTLVFVIPAAVAGGAHFEHAAFWIGYILVLLAYFAQMACGYLALRGETLDKVFLRIPLLHVGHAAVVLSTVFGALFLAVPVLPAWIGGIVALLVTAWYVLAATRAVAAAENVEAVDQKVEKQTAFVHTLTGEAAALLSYAQSEQAKEAANRVYEAIRYADPMSVEALNDIEEEIFDVFTRFTNAVKSGDDAQTAALAEQITQLIGDRNQKCKYLKLKG